MQFAADRQPNSQKLPPSHTEKGGGPVVQKDGSLQEQGPAGGRDFPQRLRCCCRTALLLCRLKEKRPVTSGEILELSKAAQSTPCVTTSTTETRQQVMAAGNCLLKGTEVSIFHSLERYDAYQRLISKMSLRDYQASHSPLMISCCCCFTWVPVIQAEGVIQSEKYQERLQSTGSGGKGL